jgi:hypothetical protein
MTRFQIHDNGLRQSQIVSPDVASEAQGVFLKEVFIWVLDPAHWPRSLKESETEIGRARKKQKRQQFRAYQALSERVGDLLQKFPHDKALLGISEIMSARIKEFRDSFRWVAYTAEDGYNWFMRRGAKPAIGPRLLLAVCIAKELWPERSPYQVVVEQMGHAQDHNPDVVNNHIRAVEKQVFRVLRQPEKYPVAGADRTRDPYVLLRSELFDFKAWKERQHERADMTIEEFDQQFDDYMNRIHPTPEEEKLLRTLFEKFAQGSRSRSKQA